MNKDDLIKYGLIGAAIYFAWPYLQQWLGALGTGTVPATGDAAAIAAAAKKAAGEATAKAVATQTAEDTAKAAAAKATADAAAAAAKTVADANTLFIQQHYTNDQVAAEAAALGTPAVVAEANRRGMKFNWDQWNWYRASYAGAAQPDPLTFMSGNDRTAAVPVGTYLAARVSHGLSGLGELGFVHPILHWVT